MKWHFFEKLIFVSLGIFLASCGGSKPKGHYTSPTVQTLFEHHQFQEASWVALFGGHLKDYEDIQSRLENMLKTDTFTPLIFEGYKGFGVPTKAFLKSNNGYRAIFKPTGGPTVSKTYSYWESEVGTYLLDQLLGLHIVPMTIGFSYHGKQGSLQFMVDEKGLGLIQGGGKGLAANFESMQFLDYVIGNVDRDNTFRNSNWFYWPDQKRVIAFDHGLAFQNREGGCFVPGTNDLYLGYVDYLREPTMGPLIGPSATYPLTSLFFGQAPCSVTAVRVGGAGGPLRNLVSAGGLQGGLTDGGVTDQFNFAQMDSKIRSRIKAVTDSEIRQALEPYIRPGVIPGDNMQYSAFLDRLHRFQDALISLGY